MSRETTRRKADHIRISLTKNVNARRTTTGFEDIAFVHRALPGIEKQKIDTSTAVFNHRFRAPLIVGAITGGTKEAAKINATIAEAVEKLGLGMGVGSQRAAVEKKHLEDTFSSARKTAPNTFLIANLGGVQLVNGYGIKEVRTIMDMIDADALAIHLNALQEAVQPEGQTNFGGVLAEIGDISKSLGKPVIVKETGAGIAAEEAVKLENVGISGIDISGAGGTSWAGVEYYRTEGKKDIVQRKLGEVFWDWGIPTVASLVEVLQSVNVPVIASGGVRDGLDIAKAVSLGASLTSFSQPALHAAVKGTREVENLLSLSIEELKTAMFLVGADSLQHLRKTPIILLGKTSKWLNARGFDVHNYARRGRSQSS